MRISIVIPVLNEAARIGPLVTWLKVYGGPAVAEIWVVDSGSTDDTAAEARAAGAQVVQCRERSRAAQMNLGAEHAGAEILYFIHADTRPPESFAADIQEALQKGAVMGCYRYRFDSPSWILRFNAYFTRFSFLWCQGGDKTFFIKKDLFDALGRYDPYYCIMEEYAFLQKAMRRHPLHIIPKNALVSARKYQNNSWLRVQWANFVVFNLFRLGVAPVRLKNIYRRLLHSA
jgi:rSAM/selenodomain-associated transferase 2